MKKSKLKTMPGGRQRIFFNTKVITRAHNKIKDIVKQSNLHRNTISRLLKRRINTGLEKEVWRVIPDTTRIGTLNAIINNISISDIHEFMKIDVTAFKKIKGKKLLIDKMKTHLRIYQSELIEVIYNSIRKDSKMKIQNNKIYRDCIGIENDIKYYLNMYHDTFRKKLNNNNLLIDKYYFNERDILKQRKGYTYRPVDDDKIKSIFIDKTRYLWDYKDELIIDCKGLKGNLIFYYRVSHMNRFLFSRNMEELNELLTQMKSYDISNIIGLPTYYIGIVFGTRLEELELLKEHLNPDLETRIRDSINKINELSESSELINKPIFCIDRRLYSNMQVEYLRVDISDKIDDFIELIKNGNFKHRKQNDPNLDRLEYNSWFKHNSWFEYKSLFIGLPITLDDLNTCSDDLGLINLSTKIIRSLLPMWKSMNNK